MIKKIGLIFLLALYLFLPYAAVRASAQSTNYGLNTAGNTAGLKGPGTSPASTVLATEAGRIIGTLLAFLGVIFLALMIAGGIMWMTAGGSPNRVALARGLIVAAIIGLVIVLSAYAITTFVASNLLAQ
jgi:hypothetical protein